MTTNKQRFVTILTDQYTQLFALPEYKMAAVRYNPAAMAEKFTNGLIDGSSSNNGDGVKRTCKALGIKCTYKAIKEYLVG